MQRRETLFARCRGRPLRVGWRHCLGAAGGSFASIAALSARNRESPSTARSWQCPDRPSASAGVPVFNSGSAQTSNHPRLARQIGSIPAFLIDDTASGLPSASMKARPISGDGDDACTPADQTV